MSSGKLASSLYHGYMAGRRSYDACCPCQTDCASCSPSGRWYLPGFIYFDVQSHLIETVILPAAVQVLWTVLFCGLQRQPSSGVLSLSGPGTHCSSQ